MAVPPPMMSCRNAASASAVDTANTAVRPRRRRATSSTRTCVVLPCIEPVVNGRPSRRTVDSCGISCGSLVGLSRLVSCPSGSSTPTYISERAEAPAKLSPWAANRFTIRGVSPVTDCSRSSSWATRNARWRATTAEPPTASVASTTNRPANSRARRVIAGSLAHAGCIPPHVRCESASAPPHRPSCGGS